LALTSIHCTTTKDMAPTGENILFQYGTGEQGRGLSEDGHRQLKQPRGVSIGADGALLVADYGSHCVLRFGQDDASGKVVAGEKGKMLPTVDLLKDIDRPLGPAEGEGLLMKRPIDVCAHHQGGVLALDAECCRVQHYCSPVDKAITVIPSPNGPPQKSVHTPEAIKYPRAVLSRPGGDIVLCDTWSHRVLCYPADGGSPEVLAGKANSSGNAPEQMSFPSGIAFDGQGCLYVTDTNNHRVQRFLPGETTGTTVAGSAAGLSGAGLDELNMPTGLCIDPRDGSLLVADRMNGRVLRFAASAGQKGEVVVGPDHLKRPWGICQDAEGAIYVSDERRAVVLKVEPPALLTSQACPPVSVMPTTAQPKSTAVASAREESPAQALEHDVLD